MLKIILSPLDSETAQVIAQRRGVAVGDLVSNLIQREAAIEITSWQNTPKNTDPLKPIVDGRGQVIGADHG
jgi:hypothetical protein